MSSQPDPDSASSGSERRDRRTGCRRRRTARRAGPGAGRSRPRSKAIPASASHQAPAASVATAAGHRGTAAARARATRSGRDTESAARPRRRRPASALGDVERRGRRTGRRVADRDAHGRASQKIQPIGLCRPAATISAPTVPKASEATREHTPSRRADRLPALSETQREQDERGEHRPQPTRARPTAARSRASLPQPQRDVGGLHGVPDHAAQSPPSASRSTSSRSRPPKASSVRAASYLRR